MIKYPAITMIKYPAITMIKYPAILRVSIPEHSVLFPNYLKKEILVLILNI
jgi:hypothetical protein